MSYTKYFTNKVRDNGKEFYCLKDGAPIEIQELIRAIHFDIFEGAMPNDWVYATIMEAFEDITDNDSYDINDLITTDIYNSDLFQWLQDCPYSQCFCDEALQEGWLQGKGLTDIIQGGQYIAKERIYRMVAEFLEEQDKYAEV